MGQNGTSQKRALERPMCDSLSLRAAGRGKDEFFALDHGLQGHPRGGEPSGDHTPMVLSGRIWAEKQGFSHAPGERLTPELC